MMSDCTKRIIFNVYQDGNATKVEVFTFTIRTESIKGTVPGFLREGNLLLLVTYITYSVKNNTLMKILPVVIAALYVVMLSLSVYLYGDYGLP
jgi:hypothetical protein